MREYSDKEIIRGLRNRQNEIIYYIREEYLTMVIRLIETNSGDYHDAQDVFQEALLACVKIADKADFELTAKFSTLFYAISKKRWLYKLKVKDREKINLEVYSKTTSPQEFENNEAEELYENKVLHYFEKLSDVCKKIIRLYSKNISVKAIAEKLGNTEKYIRKRKYECKNRLIKLIDENINKI